MRVIPRRVIGVLLILLLAGCARTLPSRADHVASVAKSAPMGAPLADVALRAGVESGATGVWPLPEPDFALDARIGAIERATTSVDLQTYLIADDPTGRQMLRALRDAAGRGVRVRLLVDDMYTAGLDELLTGLASHANVEVRLFNPFLTERASVSRRVLALIADFRRLDHRMHNKLFLADGAVAIVGGRNLADEYFLRGRRANFFDVDLLLVGALVKELNDAFDDYWNCEQAYDVRAIVAATRSVDREGSELRAAFEQRTAQIAPVAMPSPLDLFGAAPFSAQIDAGRFRVVRVSGASAYADPPEKARAIPSQTPVETLTQRFLVRIAEAREELVVFAPYFVPNDEMKARLRALRERKVPVRVITNSLAVSDEPITTIVFERHRHELLEMGVDLYQLSAERLRPAGRLRTVFGSSTGRLHAKMALVDRRVAYVGSLNLDGRSARINTEIGVRVESVELVSMLLDAFRIEEAASLVRLRLQPNGGLAWSVLDAQGREQPLGGEPDASAWRRLRLRVLALPVPEEEL